MYTVDERSIEESPSPMQEEGSSLAEQILEATEVNPYSDAGEQTILPEVQIIAPTV